MKNLKGWVMVQHGFRGRVLAVAGSKRELMDSPLAVLIGRYSFKEWARQIQRDAQEKKA